MSKKKGEKKPFRFDPAAPGGDVSPVQVDTFFRHLNESFEPSLSDAAKLARITKAQFQTLLRKDMAFAARYKEWEDSRADALEERAYQVAMRGDPGMLKTLLAQKRPDEWGPGKAKGAVNLNVTPDDLKAMTDEELAELKRRCLE